MMDQQREKIEMGKLILLIKNEVVRITPSLIRSDIDSSLSTLVDTLLEMHNRSLVNIFPTEIREIDLIVLFLLADVDLLALFSVNR